jgi:hypothetical protein
MQTIILRRNYFIFSRPQTRDFNTKNEWFGNNRATSGSPVDRSIQLATVNNLDQQRLKVIIQMIII